MPLSCRAPWWFNSSSTAKKKKKKSSMSVDFNLFVIFLQIKQLNSYIFFLSFRLLSITILNFCLRLRRFLGSGTFSFKSEVSLRPEHGWPTCMGLSPHGFHKCPTQGF